MAEQSKVPETNQEKTAKTRRLLPFNVSEETRQRFLKHFEKSSDENLSTLLDAYEQRSDAPANERISELQSEIQSLHQNHVFPNQYYNPSLEQIGRAHV